MSREVDTAKVRLWLSRRRLLGAALGVMAAGALGVLGAAALAVWYTLIHVLLRLVLGGLLGEEIRAGIPFAFVALLFAANWVANRAANRRANRRARRGILADLRPETGSSLGSLRAACRIAASVLLAGPRLVAAAFTLLTCAARLFQMDVRSCTRVVALLYERGGRVSLEEIARALPDVNPAKILPQLADIRGVTLHASDPPGVSLTDQLRGEIGRAVRGGAE